MTEQLDISEAATQAGERRRGFLAKLKRGLTMTHTEIIDRIGAAVQGRAVVEEETLEELEESLIAADLGVETTMELVESRLATQSTRELVEGFASAIDNAIESGESFVRVTAHDGMLDEARRHLDAAHPQIQYRAAATDDWILVVFPSQSGS